MSGTRTVECNGPADRCARGLDRAKPYFAPRAQRQRVRGEPFPTPIPSWVSEFLMSGTRTVECNGPADRCARGLDRAKPYFAPRAQRQRVRGEPFSTPIPSWVSEFLMSGTRTVKSNGPGFVKDSFPGCTVPTPPLCKGRWAGVCLPRGVVNPSVKNQIDF